MDKRTNSPMQGLRGPQSDDHYGELTVTVYLLANRDSQLTKLRSGSRAMRRGEAAGRATTKLARRKPKFICIGSHIRHVEI